MKTDQKTIQTPRPVKRKGRYATEEEAVIAKRNQLMASLKDVDLKKLTL